MAAPGGKFFIQEKMETLAPHHENYKQLWQTKWKPLAEMGVYPFMFGAAQDFLPIVDAITAADMKEPYDWDAYARMYFPQAEHLKQIAQDAEAAGETEKASEYYLRSSAVYRIARFPAPRSPVQREAWTLGKAVFLKGQSLKPHPVHEVLIPHTHALASEGKQIPAYHLVPPASSTAPVPCLILICGLDGYRTELAVWAEPLRAAGIATLVLEVPGTGDCPAQPEDPKSPDRLYSSVLDWIESRAYLARGKTAVWSFSTGGYHGIRIAHTHWDRLAGVVALGGGCHYMFSPAWLAEVNHLEYPFDLAHTLAHKFSPSTSPEAFFSGAQARFSLLLDGTLDSPDCTRLLLVNGTEDEIFPIDDYYLALQHGRPKEARFVKGRKHMGEPESFGIIVKWVFELFGIQGDVAGLCRSLPFKAKY